MKRRGLYVPDLAEGCSILDAALGYARAEWYIGPVLYASKNPGSYLGTGWQHKTSNDLDQVVAWLAGRNLSIFLHMGRSGAIGFDVDNPEKVHPALAAAIKECHPPDQSTRANVPGRGHYPFASPPGRRYTNSPGGLGTAWGQVRARGVLMTAPSVHEKASEGGLYRWDNTGYVPLVPDYLDELLSESGETCDAATDAEVEEFQDRYTGQEAPRLLRAVLGRFRRQIDEGGSRHDTALSMACWAAREARAGAYPARDAFTQLQALFITAMATPTPGSSRVLTESEARKEFFGIIAWAVGQAEDEDLDKIKWDMYERLRSYGSYKSRPTNSANGPRAESSWRPLDLSAYLSGPIIRPTPGILFRTDGVGLFYRGKLHWMYGESESGKSWVVQGAAAAVLHAGGWVLYLDFESDPEEVIGRLRLLGASVVDIQDRLVYVRPDDSFTHRENATALDELLSRPYDFAAIDGITDALGLEGASTVDTDEVARFMRELARRIPRETGAATACVDHVTKDPESRVQGTRTVRL
ncbi:MAG: bifunctional DNA primase/polymerase [Actinobacteria bacterium]|nr:bifunctional DNA primase/polymerase [Actinomycetota bacterium]